MSRADDAIANAIAAHTTHSGEKIMDSDYTIIPIAFPKVEERSERELIEEAIASFPATFTLSDETLRIAKHQSFMRGEQIILYVQVQRDGQWKDYAKTTTQELRALLVRAAPPKVEDDSDDPTSVFWTPSAETMKLAEAAGAKPVAAKPKKVAKPKKESRSAKWMRVTHEAISALEELQSLQEEFASWRDNLPENLQQSALGEKLETVCDLDLQSALDVLDEAQNAELPLGFGRD